MYINKISYVITETSRNVIAANCKGYITNIFRAKDLV